MMSLSFWALQVQILYGDSAKPKIYVEIVHSLE